MQENLNVFLPPSSRKTRKARCPSPGQIPEFRQQAILLLPNIYLSGITSQPSEAPHSLSSADFQQPRLSGQASQSYVTGGKIIHAVWKNRSVNPPVFQTSGAFRRLYGPQILPFCKELFPS